MLPQSLKTYLVYVKEDGKNIEDAVFVKEGFSFTAAIFKFFWSFYHQLWRVTVIAVLFYCFLIVFLDFGYITDTEGYIVEFGFLVWLGMNGQDWYGASLKRRGYVLMDIVTGTSLPLAQQRFFDRYYRGPAVAAMA